MRGRLWRRTARGPMTNDDERRSRKFKVPLAVLAGVLGISDDLATGAYAEF